MTGADEEQLHGLTAIAIDADKNSQSAVKWAVENLVNGNNPQCVLVHVQCKTTRYGDNMNQLPKEGRPPNHQELQHFFLPYRGFCARRGIETKEVVIHDIDIPSALVDYTIHNQIRNIVVGTSQRNALTRKFKNADVPSTLLKIAPETCAVYVISKGKVNTFRLASRPLPPPTVSTHSSTSIPSISSLSSASTNSNSLMIRSPLQRHSPTPPITSSNNASTTRQENHWELPYLSHDSVQSNNTFSPQFSPSESLKSEGFGRFSPDQSGYNDKLKFSFNTNSPTASSGGRSSVGSLNRDSMYDIDPFSGPPSFRSTNPSCNNLSRSDDSSTQLARLDAEMERLKLELQQSMELFSSVTKEAVVAKNARELHRAPTWDLQKGEDEQIDEGAGSSFIEMEIQNNKAVQVAQRLAELEPENKVQRQADERRKPMESMNTDFRCRRYTINEIEAATNHFAPSHKIGEGGYGPVYKGVLNHINVAIKIVRPDLSQGQKQFRQEVDVLSNMRHPNMVILLGACPEYGCLVYEFMENGSLEDRLFRKGNTPPIPWRVRFRIAFEIATALLFLHETKPEPLVHRDLKPANILLDPNFVSKIADVGLARLIPLSIADVTQCRMTAAAGTFYYIDPEYQQTGMLSVKSDLFSFGVVLLQILTAKPPMGLCYHVEDAIDNGKFPDMLDKSLDDWPVQEALSLANIAIKCCELRKRDRPDLASVILPELQRLKDFALCK